MIINNIGKFFKWYNELNRQDQGFFTFMANLFIFISDWWFIFFFYAKTSGWVCSGLVATFSIMIIVNLIFIIVGAIKRWGYDPNRYRY